MTSVQLIDLAAQYATLRPAVDEAVTRVLSSAHFIGGREVAEFERAWAAWCGSDHALGCANGTDAIELVLDAYGIGPGDEVIVPAMSWISTSEVVATRGATPIFVDVDPRSYCLTPEGVAAAITPRTRAVIVVHLYGNVADAPALQTLCATHGLPLIEDCAQAHGATFRGRAAGSFGAAATFSFFPSKSLGAYGDAGAITTDDADLCDHCHALAHHGMPGRRHHHILHGRNSRLDALQAAVLNVKLPHLRGWIERKQQLADHYRRELAGLPALTLPWVDPEVGHGYHLFVIRCADRDGLADHLAAAGVSTAVHYPTPLPLHACYADRGLRAADFPVATELAATALSLPMYAELPQRTVSRIAGLIKAYFA